VAVENWKMLSGRQGLDGKASSKNKSAELKTYFFQPSAMKVCHGATQTCAMSGNPSKMTRLWEMIGISTPEN
jgi:hypothetical protein